MRPLSALDAKVRAHLRHEIKELQSKLGITTVMVTHDQEEALDHGLIESSVMKQRCYRASRHTV